MFGDSIGANAVSVNFGANFLRSVVVERPNPQVWGRRYDGDR